MKSSVIKTICFILIMISSYDAKVFANMNVSGMFSDNAVLQQGVKAPIWGNANDGEIITVKFNGQQVSTIAGNNKWIVYLKPMKAGGPHDMTVECESETIAFKNIMIGEVWLCAGQSNMIWKMAWTDDAEHDISNASDPYIRLYQVPPVTLDEPSSGIESEWKTCSPESVSDFSAVAYYFGKKLREYLGVPVGLINASGAATMIQAFMPQDILSSDTEFNKVFDLKFSPDLQRLRPCGAFNGMIYPIHPYGIKGVLWYQGEANTHESGVYLRLMPSMIKSWRDLWDNNNLPFVFTQLPSFDSQENIAFPTENEWAEMRDVQYRISKLVSESAMTCIIDLGQKHDIHPRVKKPVGERLALTSLTLAYKEPIVSSGPIFKSMSVRDDRAILEFDSVGSGLSVNGDRLLGFTISKNDVDFVPANASIYRNKVVLSAPSVDHPVSVRYGWSNYTEANLFNKNGLPALPFRIKIE